VASLILLVAGITALTLWTARLRAATPARDATTTPAPALPPARAVGELDLGDVVSVRGEDLWIRGAIDAREGASRWGRLLLGPGALGPRALLTLAPPLRDVCWLAPVTIACPTEPPSTLEIAGRVFARTSRRPLAITRRGEGTPDLGGAAIAALYEAGARDAALVMTSGGRALAWVGERLDEGALDRLGHVDA
jgi:hypothetical protein